MNDALINTEIRAKLSSSLPYKKYSILQKFRSRFETSGSSKTDNTDGKVENDLIKGTVGRSGDGVA